MNRFAICGVLAFLLGVCLLPADTYDTHTLVRIDLSKADQREFILTSMIDVVGAGPNWVKALLKPEELRALRARGFAVKILEEEMARDRARFASPGYCTDTAWPCYWAASKFDAAAPPAGTLMRHLLDLHLANPGITRLYDIGDSQDGGYDIIAMKVTVNPDAVEAEPKIRIYGNIHGDEVCGLMVACDVLDWVLAHYGSDPSATKLVEEAELWFIPMGNPYGNAHQQRANATGTDLNRDFWSPAYPSDPAFTQKETQAIRDLTAALPYRKRFTTSLAFHGGATCFNAVYNYTTAATPDEPLFFSSRSGGPDNPDCGSLCATPAPDGLAEAFDDGCTMPGFWYTNGGDWYVTVGDTNDWAYGGWTQLDTTIEVTEDKWPDSSEIPAYTAQYRQAVLNYMLKTFQGVSGVMADAACGTPLDGTVTAVCTASATISVPHAYKAVYTDPAAGDFHRVLPPGTYTLTCSAAGYADTVIPGVVVGAGTTTVRDCPMTSAGCTTNPCSVEVTPDGPLVFCGGASQVLTCTAIGGSGLTYQWYDGAAAISGATAETFTADSTGTHAYNCQVTGSGCPGGLSDPAATTITWQSAPDFAGIASVSNPQLPTCTLALGWNAASSACAGAVTYSVFRSTETPVAVAPGNLIASGLSGTTHTDGTGLVGGTTYHYLVRAVDGAGREDANTAEGSGAPSGPIATSTLFAESFDGVAFPPVGWVESDVNGTTGDWARSDATVHPAGAVPNSGTGLAYFNAYTASSGRSTRLHRASPLAIPASAGSAVLNFYMYHDPNGPSDTDLVRAQVSTNGTLWTSVGAPVYRYDGSSGWKQASIALDAYIGQNIYVGLLGISDNGWDCHIDDVALEVRSVSACATGVPAPPLVSATGEDAVRMAKGSGDTLLVTYDAVHCRGDKIIILRGALDDFGGYAACAQPDGGADGTTSIDSTGQASAWYNLVWSNGTTAGHPGFATGAARFWTVGTLCGMTGDDPGHPTCP